jgi:hypothetical protein
MVHDNSIKSYLSKQKAFKTLVKSIQKALSCREYKKLGCSFDEFIKQKWNISKAQAYRYLISAKVLDQLEGFEILPNYERLCRILHKYAKTTQQMKLLWKAILNITGNSPDCINSSYVVDVWKELCMNDEYSHICHFERKIMDKIETSLNNYSRKMKLKQMNSNKNNNIIYYRSPENAYQSIPIVKSNDNQCNYNTTTNTVTGNIQYRPIMNNNNCPIIYIDNNQCNNNKITYNINTPNEELYNSNINNQFIVKTQNSNQLHFIPSPTISESSTYSINNNETNSSSSPLSDCSFSFPIKNINNSSNTQINSIYTTQASSNYDIQKSPVYNIQTTMVPVINTNSYAIIPMNEIYLQQAQNQNQYKPSIINNQEQLLPVYYTI